MLSLVTRAGPDHQQPFASYGGCDVLPGANLADVLDQELGLEITEDTIVLVEPRGLSDAPAYCSRELGEKLGALLVALAGTAPSAPLHPALAASRTAASAPALGLPG